MTAEKNPLDSKRVFLSKRNLFEEFFVIQNGSL